MARSREAAQLDALAVGNFLGVAIAPLNGHLAVGVGVNKDVESTVTGQLWEEGDRGSDLAEDGGDLGLDLGFALICGRRRRTWPTALGEEIRPGSRPPGDMGGGISGLRDKRTQQLRSPARWQHPRSPYSWTISPGRQRSGRRIASARHARPCPCP